MTVHCLSVMKIRDVPARGRLSRRRLGALGVFIPSMSVKMTEASYVNGGSSLDTKLGVYGP